MFVKVARPVFNSYVSLSTKCEKLPKLPVPKLDDTLQTYLEYSTNLAKVHGRRTDFTKKAVEDFRTNWRHLQEQLIKVADSKENWANRALLYSEYLKSRSALPMDTSATVTLKTRPICNVDEQIRTAAHLIHAIFAEYQYIYEETCCTQFELFRIPCEKVDRIGKKQMFPEGDEHIIVMFKSQMFVVPVRKGGELLSVGHLKKKLGHVVEKDKGNFDTLPTSLATAAHRDDAFRFWAAAQLDERNRNSLEKVRSAQFILCIDDFDPATPTTSCKDNVIQALSGGTRNRCNRWNDNGMQYYVGAQGNIGLIMNHAFVDGITIDAVHSVINDTLDKSLANATDPDKNEELKSESGIEILEWNVTEDCLNILRKASNQLAITASNFTIKPVLFEDFGSDHMKNLMMSPDTFVQLALQLAFFSLKGRLACIYEQCSMQHFNLGRFENSRSISDELVAWLDAVGNESLEEEEQQKLLRATARRFQESVRKVKRGAGFNNHLLALCQLSSKVSLKTPPLFADPNFERLFEYDLYTSQMNLPDGEIPCYGAPSVQGYGACYKIDKHRVIVFLTSDVRNSHPLEQFESALASAFRRMSQLLDHHKEDKPAMEAIAKSRIG